MIGTPRTTASWRGFLFGPHKNISSCQNKNQKQLSQSLKALDVAVDGFSTGTKAAREEAAALPQNGFDGFCFYKTVWAGG